jgi:hypothetical protein
MVMGLGLLGCVWNRERVSTALERSQNETTVWEQYTSEPGQQPPSLYQHRRPNLSRGASCRSHCTDIQPPERRCVKITWSPMCGDATSPVNGFGSLTISLSLVAGFGQAPCPVNPNNDLLGTLYHHTHSLVDMTSLAVDLTLPSTANPSQMLLRRLPPARRTSECRLSDFAKCMTRQCAVWVRYIEISLRQPSRSFSRADH